MKLWQIIKLHEFEANVYRNTYLRELLYSKPAYDFLGEWLELYQKGRSNHDMLNFSLPKSLIDEYFVHSLRVYYIEGLYLREYILPNLVSEDFADNIRLQEKISETRLLKAREIYYDYGLACMLAAQDNQQSLLVYG